MIATEAFLMDELIEIAIGTVISQIPAAMLYLAQNYHEVKEKAENLLAKLGAVI